MRSLARMCSSVALISSITFGGAHAAEPVRVGAILALSGTSAIYGVPAANALRLLVSQLPNGELEGHRLDLVITDSEANSTKAVQLFRKLADQDSVDIIFGPTVSGESIAVVPVANQLKIPTISFAGAEPITKPVTPYMFSMGPSDRIVVNNTLGAMRERGYTKIALLNSLDAFGQSGGNIIKELSGSYGVTVVDAETFNVQDTDVSPQLMRIKAAKPDAMLIWAPNPGPSIALRNATAIGMPMQLFSGYSSASTTFASQTGAAAEGLLVPAYPILAPEVLPDSESRRAMLLQFNKDYRAKYGIAPDQTASHAIDAFLSLKYVLKHIKGPVTRQSLRDGFEEVRICGAIGCRKITPRDHRGLDQTALVLMQIKDGKWQAAPRATGKEVSK